MARSQPATKRRMRGPERRAQLLSVARQVFGRSGFHSVSMDAVAKEAGVTKPILYDHFPSKKELYLALLDADLAMLHDKVRSALVELASNRERIRASFQAYFDFVDEHAEGFRLLMQEAIGAEREFQDRVHRVQGDIVQEVAELIERESRGGLSRTDAEVVALALTGMVETVAQADPGGSPERRRRTVDTIVRLAWKGITGLTL